MAADILIVRSHVVPVGKDQVQHLEMTRDMAGYFNNTYGQVFPEPQELLGEAAVVPGTDKDKDGNPRKMSKSYGNTIEIFAEGKPLKKSVMGIVTDTLPPEAPKDPEKRIPYQLYKLFATPAGGRRRWRPATAPAGSATAPPSRCSWRRSTPTSGRSGRSASSSRPTGGTWTMCSGTGRSGRGRGAEDDGAGASATGLR